MTVQELAAFEKQIADLFNAAAIRAPVHAARAECRMNAYLPFIVSGIATGSIYGLASMGLVLTYKTSGIFNFGHGAIATAGAYFFYYLNVVHGWSWITAFVVAVVVAGPLLGLVMEPMAKRLARVGVHVVHREIAAGDIETHAMSAGEDVGRGPEIPQRLHRGIEGTDGYSPSLPG